VLSALSLTPLSGVLLLLASMLLLAPIVCYISVTVTLLLLVSYRIVDGILSVASVPTIVGVFTVALALYFNRV
jgi:hypothetical protein